MTGQRLADGSAPSSSDTLTSVRQTPSGGLPPTQDAAPDGAETGDDHGGGPYAWYAVIVLSAAMAFSLVDRFALSLLFEPIKADLGLSDTQLGLLHGVAFGLFYAGIGIPMGYAVDRWSRKWVIFWGVGVWSLATAACGFSRSFFQLLLARIGVGVGEAALAPAGYSMITDTMPRKRLATAISIFQMGSLMGGGLAFLAGGAIYTAMGKVDVSAIPGLATLAPWHLTFIVLATPGIVFLLLIALLREPKRRGVLAEAAAADASPEPSTQTAAPGLPRYLWRNRGLFGTLFVGNACLVAISYGVISWAPTVLAREFGWALSDVGLRMGLLMLTMAPGGVVAGGLLADRWSRKHPHDAFGRVLVVGAALTLPLLIATQFVQTGGQLFGLLALIQFCTGMVVGVGPAATQTLAPPRLRGQVSAVYVFVLNLIGLGIGPVLVGALSDSLFTGSDALLRALGAFTLTACVIALIVLVRFRRHLANNSGTLHP